MNESPDAHEVLGDLKLQYGTNWTKTNVTTLFEWLSISAYYMYCLDASAKHYRRILRVNSIVSLLLSTLSGVLAVTYFRQSFEEHVYIVFEVIFIVSSFSVAFSTGFMSIYNITNRLEESINRKQEWTTFSTAIASELQLPIQLRRDALYIIMKNKKAYLDLLKQNIHVPSFIEKKALKELPHPDNLHFDFSTLPHIILAIGTQELEEQHTIGKKADRYAKTIVTITDMPAVVTMPITQTSPVAPDISGNMVGNTVENKVENTITLHPQAEPPV